MKPLVRLAIALLALTIPSQIWAQNRPLSVGEEVRVRWNLAGANSFAHQLPQNTVGELVDYNSAAVLLRRGPHFVSVPMSSIRTLERRIGTKPASAPAMVIGSGLGFLAGFAGGVLLAHADPARSGQDIMDTGISAGVLVGAPLGALVAWMNSRQRGIYERVGFGSLAPGIVLDPGGQVGLSVSAPWR